MNYLFSLMLLLFSLSLQSQVLTRSSNDLKVKLLNTSENLTACKDANSVDIKLLEKTKSKDELTCSDQNSWKLVSTQVDQIKDSYVFDNQPLGVYKVVVKIPLYCSESKAYATYKIAKIYESNVLNEKEDAKTRSSVQKSKEIISIYPNPSAEKIWVNLTPADIDDNMDLTIQVVNGTGQLVKELVNTKKDLDSIELDVSDYPAGQYTVLVLSNDQILASQKIAKITK